REGPIVQIGASIGSTIGQILHVSTRNLRACVGCGAAAGIAATFNAPIAGAFFAAEVILGEFTVGSFSSLVVSSVTATAISRGLLGDTPAFGDALVYTIVNPLEMITYVILGLLAAVTGVVFVQVLYWSEEVFDRLRRVPDYVKPVAGGLGIGGLGLLLPEVMGVGYDTITAALHGDLALGVLAVVLCAKLVATTFTLGSGGSGGVFAPSLFLGAALGGALGHVAQAVLPFSMAPPGAYAVVGMGAVVAAATQAPITAILIIFEMTGDYRVILGLMASCILGAVVAQRLRRESIYTIKLARRGIDLQAGREVNVLRQIRVSSVLRPEVETVPRSEPLHDLYQRMMNSPHYEFVVVDGKRNLLGGISVDNLRHAMPLLDGLDAVAIAEDVMVQPVAYVREDDTLDVAMQQLGKADIEELPVLPAGESMVPIGTLHRQDVIKAYNKEMLKADLAGSLSTRLESVVNLRTTETVGGFVLAEIEAPSHICDKPLAELKLRRTYGVQVVLVERARNSGASRFDFPGADTMFAAGDCIIVIGRPDDVAAFLGKTA
ncbi:chloride channel protein, partial [Planctomycetota bacterium]